MVQAGSCWFIQEGLRVLFQEFQPIGAIATTPRAVRILQPLWQTGGVTLWVPEALAQAWPLEGDRPDHVRHFSGRLSDQLPQIWAAHSSWLFALATGATVRLIAPLLQHKATDPAVVVVDEGGRFVISLCGGHQSGGDRLTEAIAHVLNATPVLTGSAQAAGLVGIDTLGRPFGWQRGPGDWTAVSAAIARPDPIQVVQTAGSSLWRRSLPAEHPFHLAEPSDGLTAEAMARVVITAAVPAPHAPQPTVYWHPRVLWVGMGCERNTPQIVLETALHQVMDRHQLAMSAIAGVASLDLKADEPGLVALCRDRQWPLRCYSAEQLRTVAVPNPSAVVAAEVGTPSVAEAAALQSCGPSGQLLVSKQIVRVAGQPGAVTIAIAQAEQEYTGRTGQLWLVGTGPGQLAQITPAAQTAIAQADVVIGYSLYIDLIAPLIQPGQIVEALPITQERQRAERAIELAQWGLTVAVISSGDCGIYGMAGLVLEELRAQRWDGKTPDVQVFPGITALQAAASRVGAPLMHDFCAISLSDLLTPWAVIEKRLTAAAQADFVTALYNPRSKTRTEQLAIAQQLFLQHRHPDTPVALVRSAYRPDEHIALATLGTLLDHPVDMLTTVVIGNQSTRFHQGWMITPRGYLGFGAASDESSQ